MKFTINNIKSIYNNVGFIGLYEVWDDEPFNIFIVDDTDKIIAIYESVWSDDFKTTQYEMCHEYNNFGRKMIEVADEIMDGGLELRPL